MSGAIIGEAFVKMSEAMKTVGISSRHRMLGMERVGLSPIKINGMFYYKKSELLNLDALKEKAYACREIYWLRNRVSNKRCRVNKAKRKYEGHLEELAVIEQELQEGIERHQAKYENQNDQAQ